MSGDHHKVLVTGPPGAGKTSAVRLLSDDLPTANNGSVSGSTVLRKPRTMVELDYGLLQLDDERVVHLYGTPGQHRLEHRWALLHKGVLGLIMLIDATADDPVRDLDFFLDGHNDLIADKPVVIGITHTDQPSELRLAEFHDVARSHDLNTPIFTVDARIRSDVFLLVETLVTILAPRMAA